MTRAPQTRRLALAAVAGIACVVASRPAHAINCKDLPSPIYGTGASAPKPLFAKLGKALSGATPPETLIYSSPGACYGVDAIVNGTKLTGTANYWDAAGAQLDCDLPLVGQEVDFGACGTFATLCPGIDALPANVGDFLGPIQPYVFVVPKASSQTSISAAGAYFAYGFGATGQAAPWTDEAALIKRDPNSAAAIIIALAAGIPVAKLKGIDAKTNQNSVNLVAAAANPEAAIGFCSGETADANPAVINVLAYQHGGQDCGYWPSTTPTSFDRRNIRNGHYALWAPLHYFAKVDGSGKPTKPAAARILSYFNDAKAAPAGVDVQSIVIKSGAIPDCAMEVKRSSDMGDIQSYAPSEPCGCYYDAIATGTTTCPACSTDNDCSASATHCRFGYCEVN